MALKPVAQVRGSARPAQDDRGTEGGEQRTWRVLVADRHPIVRNGLRVLIEQQSDLIYCGEAGTTAELLEMLARERPDLLILDIALQDVGGLELLRLIRERYPDVRTLVLSMCDEAVYAERALRAGVHGYIMKTEPVSQIMAAIRRVLGGEVYVSEQFAARLLRRVTSGSEAARTSPMDRLTDRELQVFHCIGRGMKLREIAEQLKVSVKTIEAHREHIKRKLSVSSSNELLRYAIEASSPKLSAEPTQR